MKGARLITGAALALAAFAGQTARPEAPPGAVARLGSRHILAAEIEPSPADVERVARLKQGEALEQWRRVVRLAALERVLMSGLSLQFLAAMGRTVSDAEIGSLAAYLDRAPKRHQEEFSRQRADIQRQLGAPGLTPERRESLTRLLDTLEQAGRKMRDLEARQAVVPQAQQAAAQRKVAEETARTWKFHQALYHKYGGRVIFQQAGLESLDGLMAFLADCRKARRYEILDPAYASAFSSLEQYAARPHTAAGKEQADFYFAKPWWERSEQEMRQAGLLE